MHIQIKKRDSKEIKYVDEDKFTIFLYENPFGRILLKIFICPWVSKLVGAFLSSRLSVPKIKRFIINNNIDLNEYEETKYFSFNDFFSRKIIKSKRPINQNKKAFISPCDSKISVYKISEKETFKIKNSLYKVDDLYPNSRDFKNGYALIFRLCVDDYHRYCYIDNGEELSSGFIKGMLHTVRPIALEKTKVFAQNQREWALLNTDNFGEVAYIEVGAMMVGKIINHHHQTFKKGEEKGYFKFGGSTIVLLVNDIKIDKDILENSKNDIETIVKYGEKIGEK